MKLSIIAVGKRMPKWADAGYNEYASRLPKDFTMALKEIAPIKRGKQANIEKITRQEGEQILANIPNKSITVALDVKGKLVSTESLAERLQKWQLETQQINFLIGGPDGLAKACLDKANFKWSLSPLTLPHPMVRVVLAEQLYRAWSILTNHPYHRGG